MWECVRVPVGSVEVVGDVEDRDIVNLMEQKRVGHLAVQLPPGLGVEPIQQSLTDPVVEKGAATGTVVDPEQPTTEGLLEDRSGGFALAGELDGLHDVELLAEHGTDGKNSEHARGQQV